MIFQSTIQDAFICAARKLEQNSLTPLFKFIFYLFIYNEKPVRPRILAETLMSSTRLARNETKKKN